MGLDAGLAAAATLTRQPLDFSSPDDATHQLQLAHVLLDGGYDGVATVGEALAGGDHGLGTLDGLDGEVAVVDGQPWQIDSRGDARVVPLETRTPFMVVGHLARPVTVRLQQASLADVVAAVEGLLDGQASIAAVRLEGRFSRALLRSVPRQTPPYRPIEEVCAADEVRWDRRPFEGVFVGFRFPDLTPGSTIPGLHLHALAADHSTGGHSHDLAVADAVLSVAASQDVVVSLPDRGMADLLETPGSVRTVQRELMRRGPRTTGQLAADLGLTESEARSRVTWLADRGFVARWTSGLEDAAGEPRWKARVAPAGTRGTRRISQFLDDL